MPEAKVALYGRTYWDAEVEVPIDTLSAGKGKVDARVVTRLGGFAFNAARALAGRFPAGAVRLVTLASRLDWPRFTDALPAGVALDALLMTADPGPLPVSVILNPARECRILRDPRAHDARAWKLDRVPEEALAARLHVTGRLPQAFVAALLERAHASGAKVAWVGGHAIDRALERACDLICVNTREAARLVGEAGTPRVLATALAARAKAPDAVRVVTGAGAAPTSVAFRAGRSVRVVEAAPPPARRIVTLLGVGDAFAAHFVVEACFSGGHPRARPDVRAGLTAGQRGAGRVLTKGRG